MADRSIHELWQDYLFLTKELSKFLDRKDFDMFEELMKQRAAVQENIDAAGNTDFSSSQESRQLLFQVQQEEEFIKTRLRLAINHAKQEQSVSQAYDPYAASFNVGSRMDRQS